MTRLELAAIVGFIAALTLWALQPLFWGPAPSAAQLYTTQGSP